MATFSKLTKQRLMDWFRGCAGGSTPMPSDQDIMEKFGIFSEQSVRDLLAELADEGGISIKWEGRSRTISLGAKEHRRVDDDRAPLPPPVRKRDTSVDDGASKIMAIIARKSTVADEVKAEAEATSKRRIQAASSGTTIRAFDKPVATVPPPTPIPRAVPEPAPQPEPAPPEAEPVAVARPVSMVRLPTAPGRSLAPRKLFPSQITRRQVNIHIDQDHYQKLAQRAAARRIAGSSLAREIIVDYLEGRNEAPAAASKPRVSAAVMAALRDDGRDLGAFLTYLIGLGLDEHNRINAMAEAAE